jgi:hypothetical protein
MNKLVWTLVGVWALGLQGCAAAAQTPHAQSAAPAKPAVTTVTAITNVKPPVDQGSTASAAEALCQGVNSEASAQWVRAWDKAAQVETELKERFKSIAKAPASCQVESAKLRDEIDVRERLAETLCDQRSRDAGRSSQDFRARSQAQRAAMNGAFDAALAVADMACVTKLKAAEKVYDEWLALARTTCSPPSDEPQIACQRAIVAACETDPAKKPSAADLQKARACRSEGRGPTPPSPQAGERDLERGSLVGPGLETAILTGAADFFVERAEQEMSLFAAEVLGRRLCVQGSVQRKLLRNTCELLNPDTEQPVIGASPAALRAAARADLDRLPERVVEQIEKKQGQDLACGVAFAWSTAQQIKHGAALAELLKDLTPILNSSLVQTHCRADIIAGLSALSAHIKLQLGGEPAVVAAGLRSADSNRMLRLDASLITDPELQKTVKEVLRRLVLLDQVIATYRKAPTPEARADLVVAAVQVMVPIAIRIAPEAEHDINTAIDLVAQVLNKEYAQAVVTASELAVLEKVLPGNVTNALGLAAGLAQAESSDDVRQTLKDAALPLGSWRRKNESRWGATLTGMVGFQLAYEDVLQKPAPAREVTSGWGAAPALLVGVDLHYGLSRGTRLGLHVNLLDLGALGSIRFEEPDVKDTTTGEEVDPATDVSAQANPEVRVEQVFAPGFFPYVGLGPFDIGPVVSFVPSLRPARDASGEIEPLSVVRYGLVLAVDISVLPLL